MKGKHCTELVVPYEHERIHQGCFSDQRTIVSVYHVCSSNNNFSLLATHYHLQEGCLMPRSIEACIMMRCLL